MFFSSSFFMRFICNKDYHIKLSAIICMFHKQLRNEEKKKEIAEETCLNRSLHLCLLNFAATYYNVKVVNLNRYVNNFHNIYSIF